MFSISQSRAGIIERARPRVESAENRMRETCGRFETSIRHSFVIHIVVISNRRRTIEASILKCVRQKSVTTSLLIRNEYMSREPMRNKNGEIKTFLMKTSSESLPSRRNDTTLALLQPQPLFLYLSISLSLSLPLFPSTR